MSVVVDELPDADLVALACDGDRAAFAEIYDRYADRIFSTCLRMLSNRDDAAEVTSDVFLTAAQRLGQLRDPSRLRAWLFAIARRKVYRRTNLRSRTVLTGEDADVDTPVVGDGGSVVETATESTEIVRVLHDAASGLDESDRMVLELHLQGLEGSDLADALGVSATNAYQASHRMKERLERSIGALMVARQGRDDCDALAKVLNGWDGTFSVLWRKRVARHVDGCAVCSERRRRIPGTILEGVAGAAEVVPAPISLRTSVLESATLGVATGRPWPGDGFPPGDRRAGRLVAAGLAVLVALVVILGAAVVLGDAGSPPSLEQLPSTTPPSTTEPNRPSGSGGITGEVPVGGSGDAVVPTAPESSPETSVDPPDAGGGSGRDPGGGGSPPTTPDRPTGGGGSPPATPPDTTPDRPTGGGGSPPATPPGTPPGTPSGGGGSRPTTPPDTPPDRPTGGVGSRPTTPPGTPPGTPSGGGGSRPTIPRSSLPGGSGGLTGFGGGR
ncbi:MAG: sigma-70 family RNA polymerase sigma factor [Actinobacteria bacterium]|nr:sigma-70 family RNA polymerase sigma factor [Actinomycetota bacterium]